MIIKDLDNYLNKLYSSDTCYQKCKDEWNINNKTFGHCAIVTL